MQAALARCIRGRCIPRQENLHASFQVQSMLWRLGHIVTFNSHGKRWRQASTLLADAAVTVQHMEPCSREPVNNAISHEDQIATETCIVTGDEYALC